MENKATDAPIGLKLKNTGSLTNWLMCQSTTGIPVVGEGATEYLWSDRHAFTVVEVSDDGKKCVIVEDFATRSDSNGMSDCQSYTFAPNPDGHRTELAFKWGAWRRKSKYGDGVKWEKINIKFGVRSKYYDFSF